MLPQEQVLLSMATVRSVFTLLTAKPHSQGRQYGDGIGYRLQAQGTAFWALAKGVGMARGSIPGYDPPETLLSPSRHPEVLWKPLERARPSLPTPPWRQAPHRGPGHHRHGSCQQADSSPLVHTNQRVRFEEQIAITFKFPN